MRKGTILLVFSMTIMLAGLLTLSPGSLVNAADSGFDREACIKECNNTFGGDDWETPTVPPSLQPIFSRCLQDCERKAWKSFDREMDRDLK